METPQYLPTKATKSPEKKHATNAADAEYLEQLKADFDLEGELSGEGQILHESLGKVKKLLQSIPDMKLRREIFACHHDNLKAYLTSSTGDFIRYSDDIFEARQYFLDTVEDDESEPDDLAESEEIYFASGKTLLIQARLRNAIMEVYLDLCRLCDIPSEIPVEKIKDLQKNSLKVYTNMVTTIHTNKLKFQKKHAHSKHTSV